MVNIIARHTPYENFVGLTGIYFLFIYWPTRLVSSIYVFNKYNEYIAPPMCCSPFGGTSLVMALKTKKWLGRGKQWPVKIHKIPRWLDILTVYFIFNDIGSFVFMVAVFSYIFQSDFFQFLQ
ncbi:MAG: hypothetical protein ACHQAX_04930 [Gammaproteobacteria bacterium]